MFFFLFFPSIWFLVAAVAVAVHHYFVHRDDLDGPAHKESCAECCYLQPSDMANHEIWVVSFLSIAVTWTIAVIYFT